MNNPLLVVENLRTYFRTPQGLSRAVDGVSFTIDEGEILALVGESGCGKSMTALSILQLVPEPAGYIESGRVLFQGEDLLDRTWEQMREIRGKEIAMIFQEPMTSLNGVFTVGDQLIEAMVVHGKRGNLRERAIELLGRVGLPEPERAMRQYPHELSGGMRQRVMIAMALANEPKLLLADEPTTALDVTVQAQILDLLADLQRETGMAVLLITHDLRVVARLAQRVAVMYAGQIVEEAPVKELFQRPRHPYTQGLFACLPSQMRRGKELNSLEGVVPSPTAWPPGCRFAPRCSFCWQPCLELAPRSLDVANRHTVRCHLYDPEIAPTSVGEVRS